MHACIHRIHACMHTCMRIIHAYMYKLSHACIHACIHKYVSACIHACIHTYVDIIMIIRILEYSYTCIDTLSSFIYDILRCWFVTYPLFNAATFPCGPCGSAYFTLSMVFCLPWLLFFFTGGPPQWISSIEIIDTDHQ